ncbi:sensor histidine kinase [Oryzifoliimicrobium ureilyticus]|uniref:sensor histidine kinase n=1 Tax=Oryzifoliimicrobium ureilyticus TaxID=3113724 RepID=UPI0030767C36
MNRRWRFFPKASIGTYLIAMVLAIVIPIFVFVGLLLAQLEANQRRILRQETAEDARALAQTIDRQLQEMATTLRLLSSAPELESGDLKVFYDRTETILTGNNIYLIAVDPAGQQMLNTRLPFGNPLPVISDIDRYKQALANKRIQVSNVFMSKSAQDWAFNVIMPVERGRVGALVMGQRARDLARLVTTEGLSERWSAEIIDQDGNIVAADPNLKIELGSPFDARILPHLNLYSGIFEDHKIMPDMMLGYASIPGSSWKAVVWGPIATAQASILTTWRFLIVGGVMLMLVAVLGCYIVARQVRSTIREIASMADRIGSGEIVSPAETSVTEANQVAIALSNASFDRHQAEDRLHFIMHELIHRTKNLLTLAQAMMRQIARQSDNVQDFQDAVGHRLDGLVRSIELLTSEQWSGASLRRVVDIHLAAFPQAAEQMEIGGEDLLLKPEAVQNLGLALHELATNSLKYGALSTANGRIRLRWDQVEQDGRICLQFVWEETGGPTVKSPSKTGFGTTVIKLHASSSFGGNVDVDFRPEGLVWVLTAPRTSFERSAHKNNDAA